jgi:hypothetical protein
VSDERRTLIRWPGGDHDFELIHAERDTGRPPAPPGWDWVRGLVVSPVGREHRETRTFYVRVAEDGVYELLPKS